jgi:cytoskeletal protein CcmA (bactofilin family)
MWGRKEEPEPAANPSVEHSRETWAPEPVKSDPPPFRAPAAAQPEPAPAATAKTESRNGKSIVFKGDISGSEDLYVDGEVHGKIQLKDNRLTVGPSGRVQADVAARFITIQGFLKGDLKAQEKVDIRKTGSVEGQLVTAGVMIEEGAVFRGSIDIIKPGEPQKSAQPAPSQSNAKSADGQAAAKPAAAPMAAKPEPPKPMPPPKAVPASEVHVPAGSMVAKSG